MRILYIPPWTRIGPYIVGILTGYVLYKYDLKVRLNRIVVFLGWCCATAVALAIFYGPVKANRGVNPPPIAAAFYNALSRSAWALCVSWVLVCCISGYGGIVNSILSWSGWTIPSRLTYAAYLSHPIIMTTYVLQMKSGMIVDDSTMVIFLIRILNILKYPLFFNFLILGRLVSLLYAGYVLNVCCN